MRSPRTNSPLSSPTQPLLHAGPAGDRTVQRHRHLHRNIGTLPCSRRARHFDQIARGIVLGDGNVDAAFAQLLGTAVLGGIERAGDHAYDAGLDHAPVQGGVSADVTARLERDVDRRPARRIGRLFEASVSACARPRSMMVAFSDDPVLPHDDRADGGLGKVLPMPRAASS